MSGKPLMLVEDNEFDLEMTCSIMDRENVPNDIVVARNGEEALDYLFGRTGEVPQKVLPIVIVLDLKLPGIQGGDVLKHIRADKRTAKIPVVVFSSSQKASDLMESLNHGADEYVYKPLNFGDFEKSIKKTIANWLNVKN